MLIPEEARFELSKLRESMTEKDFLDHMWRLRYPKTTRKPRGTWPMTETKAASNVTELKRKNG